MQTQNKYLSDIEEIMSHKADNGADLWATPDKKLLKGSPFSTLDCAMYLSELGLTPENPVMQSLAELIFSVQRDDGRFKISPQGAIYPCQTAIAANALCHMGYSGDERLQKTYNHLLQTQYADGGWRCNKFSFGRGEETELSNPLPTLDVLDIFRHTKQLKSEEKLDKAVQFLLRHWVIRKPIGPCHYGIGTLFMQVEYPFRGYNLFNYVYVLSFYKCAKDDSRFMQAFEALKKQTQSGKIVVQRVVPKLAKLSFCKKGEASELATMRYNEILANLQA